MLETVTVQCPAGNSVQDGTPDLTTAGAVTCTVCGAEATGDKHPVSGKVLISVTFGPLGTASEFHESKVTSYELVPLDDKNRPIDIATMVANAQNSTAPATADRLYITPVPSNAGGVGSGCCAKNLHTISMYGTKPAGLSKVMVVAKSGIGASAKTLPWGWTSNLITKVNSQLKETTGRVTLNFADAADALAAASDAKTRVLLIKAIANSIDEVEEGDIVITSVTQGTARRLSEEDGARRLSTATLIVEYKILSSTAPAATPFTPADFLVQLKAAASALGATSLSTALGKSAVTVPNVGTVTTAILGSPPPVSSFAARHATSACALVIASVMAYVIVFN